MKRYVGLHQYFFFASFLDPRVLPVLESIMTEEDYEEVKEHIIDKMIEKAKSMVLPYGIIFVLAKAVYKVWICAL